MRLSVDVVQSCFFHIGGLRNVLGALQYVVGYIDILIHSSPGGVFCIEACEVFLGTYTQLPGKVTELIMYHTISHIAATSFVKAICFVREQVDKCAYITVILEIAGTIYWHIAITKEKFVEVIPGPYIVFVLGIILQEIAAAAQCKQHGKQSYIVFL